MIIIVFMRVYVLFVHKYIKFISYVIFFGLMMLKAVKYVDAFEARTIQLP